MATIEKRGNKVYDIIHEIFMDCVGLFCMGDPLYQHIRYLILSRLSREEFPAWVIHLINNIEIGEAFPGDGTLRFNFTRHQKILLREFDYSYTETDENVPAWKKETECGLF